MRSRLALPLLILAALALPAATATAAPPANDAFSAPITLTSQAPAQLGDNLDATAEPSETSYSSSKWSDCPAFDTRADCGNSVWYAFTAPTTDSYTIDTCDKGTEVDTVLVAFSGAGLGGLTKLQDNDDSCDGGFSGNGSVVTIAATAGTTYPIQVTGYAGQQGVFYLRAYPAATPPVPPAVDTRITRYQSLVNDPPFNDAYGTHSGGRRTASFAFVSTSAAATYECALDAAPYAPCSSPVGYDGLAADGTQHTFRVRSSGPATDATPSVQKFTIDRTAPDTTITGGPAEGADVNGPASLAFASTERTPPWRGRCAFDQAAPYGCNGPTTGNIFLCDGAHTFGVRSVDEAGNVDPTAATRAFTVSGSGACAAPQLGEPTVAPVATKANPGVDVTTGGTPATLTVRWGTTAAYGAERQFTIASETTSLSPSLEGLTPDTGYHYDITIRNGAGLTATTGDRTFTTASLGPDKAPSVTVGQPVATSGVSARIPFTVTDATLDGSMRAELYLDTGPASLASPRILLDDGFDAPVFPLATAIDVVDLEPGTTYHYRVLVSAKHQTLTEERTFTTPSAPGPPVVTPAGGPAPPAAPVLGRFRLKAGNVSAGSLKRSSKQVTVKVKGVPSGTKLVLRIKGAKTLASGKATASKSGTATFKVKLGAKARKALKAKRLKRVTLTVTATPPGGKASSVTITKRLR